MIIHNDISRSKGRHSRKSGNPEKNWIPGRARNDKPHKTYVIMCRDSKGVTLIELLIALLISAIIIASIYRTFIHQQKTYATQEQVADMQQNVRVAINRMMREIRMAGFGNVQGVLPVTFPGVGRTYPDVVNPDLPVAGAFTIVSAIGGSAALTAQPGDVVGAILLGPDQIQVSALAEFDINNKRYISIGGLESHFITAIDVPNRILTLNTDVGNFYQIGGTNPTLVYAVRAISYRIVIDASGSPILRRDENIGGGFQPVADNIEAIEFRNPDGSIPVNPNSMSLQVAVTARTDRPDPDLQKAGDGYRRRQFTSIILQRNRGL
jgi:prepilin-type N-terminal cleavage/methylation domain-containing protein